MKLFATALVVLGLAAPAAAQESSGGFSAGVTGGTLGIGPEVGYRMSDNFGVRGNVTFLGISRNVDSDDISYDGDLKLKSGGVMVDVHPFGGGFRLSAGARVNRNRVKLVAKPTDDVEVGDETYTPEEVGTLSGTVKANKLAPTLTLGWGGGLSRGLKVGIEAGGMFQGSPTVKDLRATGLLASDPDFQASLRREEEEVEDDIDKFKIYPIVQLSIGYRF
ncbi:hypothetical protein H9L12_03055 [Sphingomonas rhizophila]|uniref:Outer membrane beta-barrel protein n=1 Tax=Sphingomonas rhizophila TaxID=2071607 RepID=A0A7G9SCJ9_9SPHN|nr:hypothetical protein [Sphingomonas rhizophila]QNN65574.1 hypothetical protein H9L12_03055 [Sphingomonas rhizophila]